MKFAVGTAVGNSAGVYNSRLVSAAGWLRAVRWRFPVAVVGPVGIRAYTVVAVLSAVGDGA